MKKKLMAAQKSPEAGTLVNSVNKALRILECFTASQRDLSLSQITRMLGMPKSTVLNLIRTLETNGYLLHSSDSQTYQLGYRLMCLSHSLRTSMPIIRYAAPFLEELQVRTGENVYLVSHVDGQVLYLEGVYTSIRIGNYSIAGKLLPMHCTGCGKAMLAYLPEDELEWVLRTRGLCAVTKNTITTRERLAAELEAVRVRGYALDNEEETLGVKCVAMPIRDSSGYPAGAISISGTVMSMRDELLEEYAKMIARVCSVLISSAGLFPAMQLRRDMHPFE